MRARMAIRYSGVNVELREVALKHKPAAMITASPKATVPVLVLSNGDVIDESTDIMHWALTQNDPDNWLSDEDTQQVESLLRTNDNLFKIHLDHYKYFERFPEHPQIEYRKNGEVFLQQLEQTLQNSRFLCGDQAGIADIAVFPFIRQFAYVDINWFNQSPYTYLRSWLEHWLESDLFTSVMQKYPAWDEQSVGIIF